MPLPQRAVRLDVAVIRYLGRRCFTCSADLRGLAYGATIRDMGHREHVKCGQAVRFEQMRGDAVRRTQQHGQDNPVGSKSIQQPKRDRRDNEQIHRRNAVGLIAQKVFQPCDGGCLLPAMYFATVVCPTSMPSLSSSPMQAFEDRLYESRGIREAGWISLGRYHPN
jgi:hypothetical protein